MGSLQDKEIRASVSEFLNKAESDQVETLNDRVDEFFFSLPFAEAAGINLFVTLLGTVAARVNLMEVVDQIEVYNKHLIEKEGK